MFLRTAASPRFVGESVQLVIFAHTGAYALRSWGLALTFDTALLSVESTATAESYNPAAVDISGNLLGMVAVGTKPNVAVTDVTGTAVRLAEIVMRVGSGAGAATYMSAMELRVVEMLNSGGNAYVADTAGHAFDWRDGPQVMLLLAVRATEATLLGRASKALTQAAAWD